MDDDLYDEFGNYIGPEFEDSDEDEEEDRLEGNGFGDRDYDGDGQIVASGDAMEMEYNDENRIILHEDKKYYPDTDEVYPGVRTVTLDEDAQGIEEPIIKPIRTKNFSVLEKEQPNLVYSTEFMTSLMNTPSLIRNIAVLGNFHHGKTLYLDSLIQATHVRKTFQWTLHIDFSVRKRHGIPPLIQDIPIAVKMNRSESSALSQLLLL